MNSICTDKSLFIQGVNLWSDEAKTPWMYSHIPGGHPAAVGGLCCFSRRNRFYILQYQRQTFFDSYCCVSGLYTCSIQHFFVTIGDIIGGLMVFVDEDLIGQTLGGQLGGRSNALVHTG